METKKTAETPAATVAPSYEELNALYQTAKQDLDAALLTVEDLSKKLDQQEKHGAEGTIVTIGDQSYILHGDSFCYNGSKKTAKELSQDHEQLQLMLLKGSGALSLLS